MGYGWNFIMYEYYVFLLEVNVFKKELIIWYIKFVMWIKYYWFSNLDI